MTKNSNRKLDANEEPEAAVVADTPSMDVESSPLVPNVTTRFRRAVSHGKSGVFFLTRTIRPGGMIKIGNGMAKGGKLPAGFLAYYMVISFDG